MKTPITVIGLLVLLHLELPAWQERIFKVATQGSVGVTGSESGKQNETRDTLTLSKGTPVCLLITKEVSSQTARVGDRVTFRVANDVSVGGLTVVSKDTKIGATITRVAQPHPFLIDGKLSFTFDRLPLVDSQTVSLRERAGRDKPYEAHDSTLKDTANSFWLILPLLLPGKGEEFEQKEMFCVNKEIDGEVNLDKAKVTGNQAPGNWKTRVQEAASEQQAGLVPTAGAEKPRDRETAEEIVEFDFSTGQEHRIAKCHDCFGPLIPVGPYQVFLADHDGFYQVSVGSHFRSRELRGHFAYLMGPFHQDTMQPDLALFQATGASCQVLRYSVAYSQVVDSMNCNEIPSYSPKLLATASPGQVLSQKYVGDLPSSSGRGREIVTGSISRRSATEVSRVPVPPSAETYSRFDPVWLDREHIIYLRHKL